MEETKETAFNLQENNASAVRAVMSAVENTIGPKGLDTMLVDQFGEVIITNDGMTILNQMEVAHPIAKMVINAVKAQQEAAGDGTTTTALLAGELVLSGLEQMMKGVPVAQVIEGMRKGIETACQLIEAEAVKIDYRDYDRLFDVALVAGREYHDIAQLIVSAVQMIGEEKLLEESFKFSDVVKAVEGADNEVFLGVLVERERLNEEMPREVMEDVAVLVIDDALEAEALENEAMATESGFRHYLETKASFKNNIEKIIASGVRAVFVDRGVNETAEEMLSDAGIMVVSRVPNKTLRLLTEHSGARMIKRTGLNRSLEELKKNLGRVDAVIFDEKLKQVKVIGGSGKAMATVLVSAATNEIVGERERIAKDAAASVQMAVREGMVAGGGACELAVARLLEKTKEAAAGMTAFGVECVINALKRPFMHIVSNAGFNPLEKLGDVSRAQVKENNNHLSINCDSGVIEDLLQKGVVDPAYVKSHALKVAGEVAEAILRINIIIKRKPYTDK